MKKAKLKQLTVPSELKDIVDVKKTAHIPQEQQERQIYQPERQLNKTLNYTTGVSGTSFYSAVSGGPIEASPRPVTNYDLALEKAMKLEAERREKETPKLKATFGRTPQSVPSFLRRGRNSNSSKGQIYQVPMQDEETQEDTSDDTLNDLDTLVTSIECKKGEKKKVIPKISCKSRYNFLFTQHFDKIKNQEDYIKFLKKLQNVNLGALPGYRNGEPGTTSELIIFIRNHTAEFTLNIYNMLLLCIFKFGINSTFDGRNNEDEQVQRLIMGPAEALGMSPTRYKVLATFVESNLKQLFIVPFFPYTYTGQTKEEFIILMEYIKKHSFNIDNDISQKSIKKLNSINILDFVRNYYSFTICLNFLTKEASVLYRKGTNSLVHKGLVHFRRMLSNYNSLDIEKIDPKTKRILKDKIVINKESYSSELFEEMVETDVDTFLSNLKFEEENYEQEILKETI